MADKSVKKKGFFAKVKGFFAGIGKFFRDTVSEMKKVVWPSRKQVLNNTLVVLAVVLIAAIVLVALDALFGFAISGLFQLLGGVAA